MKSANSLSPNDMDTGEFVSISSLKLFKACHLQVFLKSQIIFKFSFISNLTISEVIKDLEVIFLLLFLVRCT